MNKKIIIILVLVLVIIGSSLFFLFNGRSKENSTNENMPESNQNVEESEKEENSENDSLASTNSIVIYFSATGNTERIANMIGNVTGSSVIQIVPADPYTDEDLNYSDDDCRANREQNDDDARPEIANTIDNLESYDTIYLGYPIWWGDVPKIVLTFLDTYDLEGKTIIPFCTSGSSGISTSISTLRNYNSNINVLDGRRFSTSDDESDISEWIGDLDL